MKSYCVLFAVSALTFAFAILPRSLQGESLVYETPREFHAAADFDGDGRPDWVIVDKESGKFRLGYQKQEGAVTWVDSRASGIKALTGFAIGDLLAPKRPAAAFTSPDANQIAIVDASNSGSPSRPVPVSFDYALGPNSLAAIDIGGEGNTPLADLVVASLYNEPDPNQVTLVRNAPQFPQIGDENLVIDGSATLVNTVLLEKGNPATAAISGFVGDKTAVAFTLSRVAESALELLGRVSDLPAAAHYTAGYFRGDLLDFVIYTPGAASLRTVQVQRAGSGYDLGSGKTFELDHPIRQVVTLAKSGAHLLFVVFGDGLKAGIFRFDGENAPERLHGVEATAEITAAFMAGPTLVVLTQSAGGKYSNRYQTFVSKDGALTAGLGGMLPSLADNDNITIPDIHKRIVGKAASVATTDMRAYTNTIPGTRVNYVMVPIPAGEFVMGSPETEANRNSDEGPQIKVKVSPFWMGAFEITWNEYELFMYPDEERRTRAILPTDPEGDKLADAVSHPSKPYVEMSFGMGKDGFPAISMTQHAANKYCQWLSAKTGYFYRLPTEAEWEYACRAGTTGARFFGDDESELDSYAWYEQNSDFKYQKVGRKKPNPWGLYDIYGNVVEWVLDQYDPEFYKQHAGQTLVDPWNKATKPYPHSVRGGSWDDEAKRCRSAARRGSDRSWKMQDPQLPKSVWYFSDAQWVGFRIVRPLTLPSAEEMQKYWTSGVERD